MFFLVRSYPVYVPAQIFYEIETFVRTHGDVYGGVYEPGQCYSFGVVVASKHLYCADILPSKERTTVEKGQEQWAIARAPLTMPCFYAGWHGP